MKPNHVGLIDHSMTVNGLVFPASGTFGVINPATGEVFDHAPALAPDQLGSVIALVAELLSQRWSPQQISRHLRARFPDEPRMSLCHESIYRAIYQTGSLLLRPSPSVKMVTDSLRMAIDTLNAGERPLVHSDEGFQYRHTLWRDTLREAGLTQLMSRKGTCLDNAVMEGFFSHLKEEWLRI